MKGSYQIIVRNVRLQYKFTIERNITIIKGDSATGKTTLIEMIAAYQRNHENSGITVNCDKTCVVLAPDTWRVVLPTISDSIVFIDEGDPFVASREFAEMIEGSDNYYVIVTRTPLFNLPYSSEEVYEIKNTTRKKYEGARRLYSRFYPLYSLEPDIIRDPDCIIVEDSNAGYDFFSSVCKDLGITCISAMGKSNVYKTVKNANEENILVIAYGAAFGPEIERILSLRRTRRVMIYLPESFEWLILKSDLLNDKDIRDILADPSEFIDGAEYFSWERYFTALLQEKSRNSAYLHYSKRKLNKTFLQNHEKAAILNVMPEIRQTERK